MERIINKYYWFEELGDWAPLLKPVLTDSEYITKLFNFLAAESNRTKVFPEFDDIFKAFKKTPYNSVKVVILGLQPSPFFDPYSKSLAISNGLAYGNHQRPYNGFQHEVGKITDCVERQIHNGLNLNKDNSLFSWADQGVLMLNCALTSVQEKKGLHLKPWEKFIKFVIQLINEKNPGTIFCLWGADLLQVKPLINSKLHYILEHPISPTECVKQNIAWECSHFSEVNSILKRNNNEIINW